jgi:sigma-B regulation protein RsbU (phosphoserine phosphatase)
MTAKPSWIFAKKPRSPVYPMGIFSWQSTESRSRALLRSTTSCAYKSRPNHRVSARTPSGKVKEVQIRLASREGPDFSLGGYIAFLTPILGVPLLGLLIGYWVVAARPRDLNAWLVLLLLAFPETAFGNLDWSFWPEPWYILLGLWNWLVQVYVFPALLWFGFLFPERWRVDLRLPWFKYAILAATFCYFCFRTWLFCGTTLFCSSHSLPSTLQVWTDRIGSWLDSDLYPPLPRRAFRQIAFGVDGRCTAALAGTGHRKCLVAWPPGHHLHRSAVVWDGPAPWELVLHCRPISVDLSPHPRLCPDRAAGHGCPILLRMGTKYLLARATVLTAEVALVAFLILRFIVPMMQRKEHQLLNFLLLALCIGALFQVFILRDSFSRRLQRWLDRKFFREAYNSEVVLSELAEQVRQLTDRTYFSTLFFAASLKVLHVSQIAILLRGSNVFHLQQALGMDFGGPVALPEESATIQNLLRTNQPATVYRDRPEEWFTGAGAEEKALLREIHAELLLPMSGRAHLIGLIALGPKKSEEPYTPTDLRTLQSVAAQTGLTLEVAELVRTLADQAAQRERMNREIEIAREVQQRLFPAAHPRDCRSGPGRNVPSCFRSWRRLLRSD